MTHTDWIPPMCHQCTYAICVMLTGITIIVYIKHWKKQRLRRVKRIAQDQPTGQWQHQEVGWFSKLNSLLYFWWVSLKIRIVLKWHFSEKRWFPLPVFPKILSYHSNSVIHKSDLLLGLSNHQNCKWCLTDTKLQGKKYIMVCSYQFGYWIFKFIHQLCKDIFVKIFLGIFLILRFIYWSCKLIRSCQMQAMWYQQICLRK